MEQSRFFGDWHYFTGAEEHKIHRETYQKLEHGRVTKGALVARNRQCESLSKSESVQKKRQNSARERAASGSGVESESLTAADWPAAILSAVII